MLVSVCLKLSIRLVCFPRVWLGAMVRLLLCGLELTGPNPGNSLSA